MSFVDLKVIRSTAPINGKAVTVYRPEKPIHRLFTVHHAGGFPTIMHDLTAIKSMLPLTCLAAQAKDAIVWIPKTRDRTNWNQSGLESCDLVMCHHSLQLKPSSWKEARAYARKNGKAETLSVLVPSEDDERSATLQSSMTEHYRAGRSDSGQDLADISLHSSTLFFVGSQVVFDYLADRWEYQRSSLRTGADVEIYAFLRGPSGPHDEFRIVYYEPKDWIKL